MRIDELKRIAKNNTFRLVEDIFTISLYWIGANNLFEIVINKKRVGDIVIVDDLFDNRKVENMVRAAKVFSNTPLPDREEIKKYFYKHNSMKTKGGNPTYLAIRQRPSISYPVLQGSSEDIFEYKVEFTDEEIKKAENEHGISLDDFEKNEVKGDKK